jgi:hypothetical protein
MATSVRLPSLRKKDGRHRARVSLTELKSDPSLAEQINDNIFAVIEFPVRACAAE